MLKGCVAVARQCELKGKNRQGCEQTPDGQLTSTFTCDVWRHFTIVY